MRREQAQGAEHGSEEPWFQLGSCWMYDSVFHALSRVDGSTVMLPIVSTALWTGVYLSDILEYVKPTPKVAKHVIFEGADELPNGYYGTSQKLSLAMRKDQGMIIGMFISHL